MESIRKQDYTSEYEIIVVDNASTDNTAKIALDWGAKVVYERKRSPACARQRGTEVATVEIIAFIDADTQAPACWLYYPGVSTIGYFKDNWAGLRACLEEKTEGQRS